ncbi:hypothetical protein D5086_003994 [Populus alba]|uniref:Uncharacterized protein n=1 Tax=Populus alba TaxID=43335 RepID=A0ACC4CPA6_POPAL
MFLKGWTCKDATELQQLQDSQQRSFGLGDSLGDSGIQLMESSLHPSTNSVSHSYSSSSLGQMIDSSSMGSFWAPRGQMRLQSRRFTISRRPQFFIG